jgi:hypothetical protein
MLTIFIDIKNSLNLCTFIFLNDNKSIIIIYLFTDVPRPRKRLTELLHKTALNPSASDHKFWESATKEWELRFRLSPLEILTNSSTVSGVRFGVNRLEVKF